MVDLVGGNESQTLTGSSGDDVITGLGGDDLLRGGDGNDVYAFAGAFGQDTVQDASGVDQLRIGADYGPENFRLVRGGTLSRDLIVTQVNGGQSIVIDDFFDGGSERVESVVFERTGTVWDLGSGAAFRTVGFVGTNAGETVLGSGGDDVVVGLGGNDVLRGGDGNDVYLFSGAFGQDTMQDATGVDEIRIGAEYSERDFRVVRGGTLNRDLFLTQANGGQSINLDNYFDGNDAGIERVVFERTGSVLDLATGTPVFQPGLFDYDGYLSANPDVRAAGVDAYAHYVTSGWLEGRDPSARFDTLYYLVRNPDVAAAGVNPLQHYLATGQFEGRATAPAVGVALDGRGFDASYYLLANPDVGLAGLDAATHYAALGWREGRDPSSAFDTSYYLNRYGDVRAAGIDPLEHYSTAGWREGRDPSAGFDTTAYLAANPDVAAAGVNPLVHYLTAGLYEGRSLGEVGVA